MANKTKQNKNKSIAKRFVLDSLVEMLLDFCARQKTFKNSI